MIDPKEPLSGLPDLGPPDSSGRPADPTESKQDPGSTTPLPPNPRAPLPTPSSPTPPLAEESSIISDTVVPAPPDSKPVQPAQSKLPNFSCINLRPSLSAVFKQKNKLFVLSVALLFIFIIGIAAVLGTAKFFGPTNLHFIPADAEFYLGISVRDHPQVKKLKELTKKFPGGEKIVEEPMQFGTELFGAQKDPFEDIIRLAEKEIFLAKVSETEKDETGTGLDKLLNIVDLKSEKLAIEKLNNFKEDKKIYTTTTQTFEGMEILNIKLKKKGSDSQRFNLGGIPLGITIPFSQSVYASTVDKFIFSAEKLSDLKKSLSLKDTANPLNFAAKNDLKNILSDKEHKEVSKFFPDQYLVKFYQQKPLEPFSNLLPTSAFSQTFLLGYDTLNRIEGNNFIEVNRGLVITAHDDGIRMNSYQLDWRTPKEGLINPYKISDSLATQLPEKFSGVVPSIFSETNNFKQLMEDQEKILKEVADKSDNRNQRKDFKKAVDGFKEFKSSLRKTFGVDPDKEIFSWMKGKTASIFNSGSAKKSPEFMIVAQIDNKKGVENSLKKIKIPDYIGETNNRTIKRQQESDIRRISTGLQAYYTGNNQYPKTLDGLKPLYLTIIPTDKVANTAYKYIVSSDQQTARVEGKSPDGRTVYFSSQSGVVGYIGSAKSTAIEPLTPKKSEYKGINLYSISIYDLSFVKYSMFFAVTDSKAVILFSDTNKSIKDIIDFEKKPGTTLSSRSAWKDQFGKISEPIGGLIYIEPIGFFGLWEYYKSINSGQLGYFNNQADLEIIIKGYLSTLKSIGTVVSKEKPVYTTKTFIRIKELPAAKKKKTDEAFTRYRDQLNQRRSGPILGAVDINIDFAQKARQLRNLIFP